MRCRGIERALICYAGSAPEASKDSRPIGSELTLNMSWASRYVKRHMPVAADELPISGQECA